MDFTLSAEQEALRAVARDWLDDRAPWPAAAAWDPGLWADVAGLGWLDPGLGLLELSLVAEQAGAALMPGPWLATVGLAGPAFQAAGRWPERPATLAWAEPAPGCATLGEAAAGTVCVAADGRGGPRLTGIKQRVPAAVADVVVVARTSAGSCLYLVDLAAEPGLAAAADSVDGTRELAVLRLAGCAGRPLAGPGATAEALRAARQRMLILLGAEAVGVAQRAVDLGAGHARTRTQFGRPIGAYQGVAHRLADAAAALELARCLVYRAAWCADAGDPGTGEAVLAATVAAREAGLAGCEAAIQVLGGMGFSWEHPLHRLYRRARWIACFDGPAGSYRAELAALVIDGPDGVPNGAPEDFTAAAALPAAPRR